MTTLKDLKKKNRTVDSIQKEIDKLYAEKEVIIEKEKKKLEIKKQKDRLPLDKLKDYGAVDICNIWGIFPFFKRYEEIPEEFIINKNTYSLQPNVIITSQGFGQTEKIILSKTKFTRQYLENAKKIASILGYNEEPRFYMITKDGVIQEDQAMIMFIGSVCFMFAPRVESD